MARWSPSVLAWCAFSAIALESPEATAFAPRDPKVPQKATALPMRGMTISCPGWGHIWGSPLMRYAVREVKELGVDWVAIHPYATIERDGTVSFSPAAHAGYLRRAVEITRAEGAQVFWKPHLAYWGRFSWRGEIEFGNDEEKWSRFFRTYREFIVDQASFAQSHGIGLFSVGVEYEKTLHREKEWRRIIQAVRKVYRGRLTYSTNWDSVERVPFWDSVDLIGVQAYFPISSKERPTRAEVNSGWDRILSSLAETSKRHAGKPVLFTEIGYARSRTAAIEPWKPQLDDSAVAIELRTMLLEAALDRMASASHVVGAFWWKWMPNDGPHDRDFSMKDPEARRTLARHWAP